jgi:hypothetical protein
LGIDLSRIRRPYDAREKYELPLHDFRPDPVPVYAIYVLDITEQDRVTLIALKGFDKIQELTTNTYHLHYLQGMQREQRLFHQAQTLARQARVVRVTRPHQQFLLDELADRIERDLSQ